MKMDNLYLITMGMKSTIKHNILILFGTFFVAYILSVRLLIERLPKALPMVHSLTEVFIYGFIITGFFMLGCINLILWYRKNIIKKEQVSLFYKRITNKIKILADIYWKSLRALDSIIKDNISSKVLGSNLLRFTKFYNKHINMRNRLSVFVIFFICDVFPKYLFLLLFFYDVIVLHMFNYIYASAWLLLIPLIFNYTIFTLKEFSEFNINLYNNEICDIFDDNFNIITSQDVIKTSILHANILLHEGKVEPSLIYIKLKEKYVKDKNDEEILVSEISIAKNLFNYRLMRQHTEMFGNLHYRYGHLLNSLKFYSYSIIWFYILIYAYIY